MARTRIEEHCRCMAVMLSTIRIAASGRAGPNFRIPVELVYFFCRRMGWALAPPTAGFTAPPYGVRGTGRFWQASIGVGPPLKNFIILASFCQAYISRL
jgi:hypothetical protein